MSGQRDLKGASALVTGATSGIGRAAAEEPGRHGAEVAVRGAEAAYAAVRSKDKTLRIFTVGAGGSWASRSSAPDACLPLVFSGLRRTALAAELPV
jgi:NAD(P)-dependent dehydrogenase (short-subunit alcohol dehydrogenase family)